MDKAQFAASCKKAGQVERAQKLVEELLGPDAEMSDLGLVRFAGQVQMASGYRVIEKRIKKVEDENKDSVQYWLRRASYYIGRKEIDQANDAFKRALALPPDDYRRSAVGEYARFLIRTCKQYDRAKRVLREELRRIAPNYDVVSPLVYWLLELDSKYDVPISADDPLLWQFLADREMYDYQEERVLKILLGKLHSTAATGSSFARAVKLAGPDARPSRRYIVGRLLLRADRARQAVPLLEDAFRRWPHPATRFQPGRSRQKADLLFANDGRTGRHRPRHNEAREHRLVLFQCEDGGICSVLRAMGQLGFQRLAAEGVHRSFEKGEDDRWSRQERTRRAGPGCRGLVQFSVWTGRDAA